MRSQPLPTPVTFRGSAAATLVVLGGDGRRYVVGGTVKAIRADGGCVAVAPGRFGPRTYSWKPGRVQVIAAVPEVLLVYRRDVGGFVDTLRVYEVTTKGFKDRTTGLPRRWATTSAAVLYTSRPGVAIPGLVGARGGKPYFITTSGGLDKLPADGWVLFCEAGAYRYDRAEKEIRLVSWEEMRRRAREREEAERRLRMLHDVEYLLMRVGPLLLETALDPRARPLERLATAALLDAIRDLLRR
jgi:hypothetical protein